jgi:threonine dehydratase
VSVIGCEPDNDNDYFKAFYPDSDVPPRKCFTIADGLRGRLGKITWPVIREHVKQIITVSEDEIVETMKFVYERAKIVIEPSSAAAIAPVLYGRVAARSQRVGVIISGGNVDLSALPF